ncbi:hypothetical protein Lesp02_31800 [Lentzea sp. NBRC 105346]|nr:hypothetical protein Lesp02_31800 [Lentzea sp. NBRC 105346]
MPWAAQKPASAAVSIMAGSVAGASSSCQRNDTRSIVEFSLPLRVVFDGMGHNLSRELWPERIAALVNRTRSPR